MTWYLYPPMPAVDATGQIVRSGTGQIYAETDSSGTTPLPLRDVNQNTISSVLISDLGLTQAFMSESPEVILRSGQYAVPLSSPKGMRLAAEASAASSAESALSAQIAAEAAAAAATDVFPDASGADEGFSLVVLSKDPLVLGWAAGGGDGAVFSVNGRSGAVTLSKTDVGLGNVDNTSDLDKPVSTAQATAISSAVSNKSNVGHTHAISDVTSLQQSLDSKMGSNASITIAQLPAKSVVGAIRTGTAQDGAWEARPTTRADIVVHWRGAGPAPDLVTSPSTGGRYAGDIVDLTS